MSLLPSPPGLSDEKYKVLPSASKLGCESQFLELTTSPKFSGVDHTSPYFLEIKRSQLPIVLPLSHIVKIKVRPFADIEAAPSLNSE